MTSLTKADLAEALFNELGLNKREAKEFVELFFEKIREALQPFVYKLASFWGGLDGSLLFWVLLLAIFGTIAVHVNRERHRELPLEAL